MDSNTFSFVRDSSTGLKRVVEKAVVNEPSVFEPLELHCMTFHNKLPFHPRGIKLNIVDKRTFAYVQQSMKSSSRSANNTSAAEAMSWCIFV